MDLVTLLRLAVAASASRQMRRSLARRLASRTRRGAALALRHEPLEGRAMFAVAPPSITVTDVSVGEEDGGRPQAVFTLLLSERSRLPVTVRYATGDGTATAGVDYVAKQGLITFPVGKRTRTVQVSLTPDALPEADETFRLRLSAPRRARLADVEAVATIVDDDAPAPLPVAPTVTTGTLQAGGVATAAAVTGEPMPAHGVFFVTWRWDERKTFTDFDPATDVLALDWFRGADLALTEQNGSTVLSIPGMQQSYTLLGVPLGRLTMANFTFKDASAGESLASGLGGIGTIPIPTPQPTPPAPTSPPLPTTGEARCTVTSDWGSGFNGEVTLTNTGSREIAGWTVSFDFDGAIATIWNGTVASQVGTRFTVRGASWNANLAAAATTSFGFTASPGGAAAMLRNLTLDGLDTSTPPASPPPAPAPSPTPPPPAPPAAPALPPGGLNSGNAGDEKWGEAHFAPYVDMGLWPVPDLVDIARARGVSLVTLGFMQATPEGKLAWAGLSALTPDSTHEQAVAINRSIAALQAAGGDVMISLGGAAGTSLAQWHASRGLGAAALADAYLAVVDTYRATRIDFDIEGAAVADPPSIALTAQAIALLQQARPGLEVWYTLPVLPTGLTADGLAVVHAALAAGVVLDGVNVMAMDYGESAAPTSGPAGRSMADYAILAARAMHAQLTTLFAQFGQGFGWRQLGVTPMIGVNDVLSEIFTLTDAQRLETFAREQGLGMLSMWSVARDNPGTLGQATATASGLDVPAGSFCGVFNDYGTRNILVAPSPTPPAPATVQGFFRTAGNQIVDAQGNSVRLAGVNWFGLETPNFAPHGLWTRGYREMMDQMKSLGFNTIRLPYSDQLLTAGAVPNGIDVSKNPDLGGRDGIGVMDAIVAYADQIGLKIILDHHRSEAGSGPNGSGLWSTAAYPEATWIANLAMLARRYAGTSAVVGIDLHNEPHGPATWGDGGPHDWRLAAERAGNAVLAANPNLLIIVEGVETTSAGSFWWGGNLSNAAAAPVRLSVANRLVYSPHDYPASVYPQPFFAAADYPANLPAVWDRHWGHLYRQGIAPVLIGEFGTKLETAGDKAWFDTLVKYLGGDLDGNGTRDIPATAQGPSWTYWSWNPNSGDTGGILADDWRTVQGEKLDALRGVQFDLGGSLTPAPAPGPAPAPVPAPTPVPAPDPAPSPAPGDTALPITRHDTVLAAYFPEWGIYGRNFQVADVPADKLTHLMYAFLDLTSSGEVALFDSYAAIEKRFPAHEAVSGEADQWYYPPTDPRSQQTVWGNFAQLQQLKAKHPHLRITIAVGGWTLSDHFSTVCATAAGRERFAESLVRFLDTYRMFDGVDFDWEYPGGGGEAGNSASPDDGRAYALLLGLVRQKFEALGGRLGRRYEITVASPAGLDKIATFNLAGLTPHVDHFNLMAYDFHGTWESTTGHQAAFTGDQVGYDVQTAVNAYLQAGVPAQKIVLGAPLYTRAWSGVNDGGDGGYAAAAAGAAPGSFEAGNYDYKDLLARVQSQPGDWQLYWDDRAQATYVYNARERIFSSFETPTSIAQRSQWAEDIGLGGMMFWDISNDAIGSPESLLLAAYQSWVVDEDLATIRARSRLTTERIVGGDGLIAALPLGG